MEIRQLEYFMAVCHELHFTRASEKLGVTQPTLSHQVKALEDELGLPLFDRIGKKTAITEAGFILLKHCNTLFHSLESVREEIRELQEIKRGSLTMGVLPGELNSLVCRLLPDFHDAYSEVQVRIITADNVAERLLHNEIDMALTITPVHDERIVSQPLYNDKLYLTVNVDHPLAGKSEVSLKDLKDLSLVLFPENYQCRQQIDAICRLRNIHLRPAIETDSIESIINLIEAGVGGSILSETLIKQWKRPGIRTLSIAEAPFIRQVGLIYHKEKFRGQTALKFTELLQEQIGQLGLSN
ncbi:LysR family transcriptional regulator [Paenibacillus sp. Z3-2]